MMNVTIDSIVRKLLERISDTEDFLKEKKKLLSLSTYFLSFVCEELNVYNEVDLVLLCYACEISLIAPFYISSIIPDHFPKKIILEDLFDLTEENVTFTYKPGKTQIIENLISEKLQNLKTSIPKKKKAVEFDPAEYHFTPYSGNFKVHYDIDGLSGMITQEPLNPFLMNLNLKVDIRENPQPVRKNCFPADFSSVKLGFVHSYLGPISVYVVFPPICEIDLSVFLFNVALLVNRRVDSDEEKLEHIISSHELEIFFGGLRQEYIYSTLYIESFGCKMGFASPDTSLVCLKLSNVIKSDVTKVLAIDIAATCVPDEDVIIFPHPSFLAKLFIKSNYMLCCSKYMANYHSNEASNWVARYGCILKINFYSLIEDLVVSLRKECFLPVHAFLAVQSNFEGVAFSKYKTNTLENKLSIIQENFHSRSKCAYRFEISVYGTELGTGFSFLKYISEGISSQFISMDYYLFKRKFLQNILFLASQINPTDFLSLGRAILAEYYLKEVFVKGSQNRHFLPMNYDLDVLGNDMFSFDVYFNNLLFSEDQALIVVNKIVRYSSLTFLKPEFLQFLKRYILILEEDNIRACLNIIYEQYVTDYINYYKLKIDNLIMNFKELNENIIYIKEEDISLNYFIQYCFLGDKPKNSKFPYICLLNTLKKKFNLSDSNLQDHLFTFIKLSGLNVGWKHLSRPAEDKKLLTTLDLDEANIGINNLKELEKEVAVESEKFLKKNTNILRRANWSSDEHVRLLNGVMRHGESKGVFLDILADVVYGFSLTRSGRNTVWDGFRGISTKKIGSDLLLKAITWEPSKLPLSEILDNIPPTSKLFASLSRLHSICGDKFRPVTLENLNLFRKKYLLGKNKISDNIYQSLTQKLLKTEKKDFKSVSYRALHTLDEEEYLLENCPTLYYPPPEEDNRNEVILETNAVKYVNEEDFMKLNNEFCKVKEEINQLKTLFLRGRQEGIFESEEQLDPNVSNDNLLLSKLLKFFKNKKFTSRQALSKLYASNARPIAEEFEHSLNRLRERGLLSSSDSGKTKIITYYKIVPN